MRHKQAKNYGAFARLITLASFLFPDPELGLCMQTRLLLGVPCAFVFEQSSSVFVALNVFASISLMPPKKILRLDSSQRTLSTFFNTTAEQNRDTVSENDRETDETDGSCETTDEGASKHSSSEERKFQSKWLTLWPWLTFEDGAMYCKLCLKKGKKNTMTAGCKTFKTSSLTRHEELTDHKHAIAEGELQANFNASLSKVFIEEDEAIMKAMKAVYWMASENLPMTKYESMMQLLKDLGVPIACLQVSERVDYKSYHTPVSHKCPN